jgi:hypothetical protein
MSVVIKNDLTFFFFGNEDEMSVDVEQNSSTLVFQ